MNLTKDNVAKCLENVFYLPKGDNITSLNMIKEIIIKDERLFLTFEMEDSNPKALDILKKQCVNEIKKEFPGAHFDTNHIKIEQKVKNGLDNIKHLIGVASGKGGVGKSMVAANLALSLAQKGYKTGLMDADIYGPSIPIMFGVEDEKPEAYEKDGVGVIHPIEKYGLKINSVGFFVDKNQALVWRGPMASNALKQLLTESVWGNLDFLIVDLPPGTGDIQLTLTQDMPMNGVVIVSTPQKIALADAIKAISMFNTDKIRIPVLGLVENMSYFTPKELPNNQYYLFGKEGVKNLAKEKNVAFLGEIPIVQSIREAGDEGKPIVLSKEKVVVDAFEYLADNLLKELK